jgi:hypothetical protein
MNFQLFLFLGFLIIFSLILPQVTFGQTEPISPPETFEAAKEKGEEALKIIPKELPGILERIWKTEVLSVWQKMYHWFLSNIWSKIKAWFKKEIEKRKPVIKEEFQKEKEELKKEAPKISKSFWEKFKELIK